MKVCLVERIDWSAGWDPDIGMCVEENSLVYVCMYVCTGVSKESLETSVNWILRN
jgi:hypothetical protein